MQREIEPTLRFSKDLIRVPSTADNERGRLAVLDMATERLQGFSSEEFQSNGVISRLFYNTPVLPDRFRIILNGHLDVVPAIHSEQYEPHEKEGKLFGRGAGDMKAAAAIQIDVFRKIAHKLDYPIGLMLVTDEEVGGTNGTGQQVAQGVATDFAIVGEPTNLGICHTMKGGIGLHVQTSSLAAHAAYPWRTKASTDEMMQFAYNMREHFPTPDDTSWQTTAALTDLWTSQQERTDEVTVSNTIPADTNSTWDIRRVPQEREEVILSRVSEFAEANTSIAVVRTMPSAHTDPAHHDIVTLKNTIQAVTGQKATTAIQHGSCDFRWFTQIGAGGVAYGPIAGDIHGSQEFVEIESLVQYSRVLEAYLLNINQNQVRTR
ncbi:MAG: M20/M25/M40 family metallo-hydrolase [Candidatus Levybacteria bacterium]|nr:M20/M25/M40 family metallo-hydrolase [Candidatus Levybacteria bacterium]